MKMPERWYNRPAAHRQVMRHCWSYAGGGEHWEGSQEEEPGWVLAAPGAPGDLRIHTHLKIWSHAMLTIFTYY